MDSGKKNNDSVTAVVSHTRPLPYDDDDDDTRARLLLGIIIIIVLCVHTAACGGVGQPISKRFICMETIVVNYFALFPERVRVFPSFCFSVFAPRPCTRIRAPACVYLLHATH